MTSAKRLPSLPDVPTMAELGYPQVTVSNWLGLVAPKGTPAPVVKKLNDAYNTALERAGEVGGDQTGLMSPDNS